MFDASRLCVMFDVCWLLVVCCLMFVACCFLFDICCVVFHV